MGKDSSKNLSSSNNTRFYSPWHLDDTETWSKRTHRLLSKEDELETCLDQDMARQILRIEQEQLNRVARNKEEEEGEENEKYISLQAQSINIHSLPSSMFELPLEDQTLAAQTLFLIPAELHRPLVTLAEIVTCRQHLCIQEPQIAQIYKKIGAILATYSSSGRLPKPLKIVPSLANWDEILALTNPSAWTSQATYEVTRLFLSNLKATQAKQFFEWVLLPAIRCNLSSRDTLDPSLYLSLKKALACNSALFIRGFLAPLCESQSCSVREACILASAVHQTKIPALQSSLALLLLANQPFSLPMCILVLTFLEKRQTLPYRVIDALVNGYFCQQQQQQHQLPVVWYQSLHIFVESYSMDMVPTQKQVLLDLLRHVHCEGVTSVIEKTIKSTMRRTSSESTDDSSDGTVEYSVSEEEQEEEGMLIDT